MKYYKFIKTENGTKQRMIIMFDFYSAMIAVFVAMVSIGTLCDIYIIRNAEKKRTPLIIRVFMCFSLYSNGKKIIATRKIEGSIDCIHGIRFFSICWVVLGHTWYVLSKSPTDNMFDVFDVSNMEMGLLGSLGSFVSTEILILYLFYPLK